MGQDKNTGQPRDAGTGDLADEQQDSGKVGNVGNANITGAVRHVGNTNIAVQQQDADKGNNATGTGDLRGQQQGPGTTKAIGNANITGQPRDAGKGDLAGKQQDSGKVGNVGNANITGEVRDVGNGDTTVQRQDTGLPSASDCRAFEHRPVLAQEVLEAFAPLAGLLAAHGEGVLIDCTLGGGGHSALLLQAHPGLRLVGLDQDPTARAAAAERLSPFSDRVSIVACNFADFDPAQVPGLALTPAAAPSPAVVPAALAHRDQPGQRQSSGESPAAVPSPLASPAAQASATPALPVLAVLADLGVSSPQLDVAGRGFSFRLDGPLDMRMNPQADRTAAQLLAHLSEAELADLIYTFGEERLARRIARRIHQHLSEQGPFSGTASLAYLIAGCYPPKARHGRIHPATRTFQALRIAVNRELEVLDRLLLHAPDWLVPGGRLAIISFHSLEDRRVKQAFLADARLERISRKAIQAGAAEQEANPRSRSARLRIAQRRCATAG